MQSGKDFEVIQDSGESVPLDPLFQHDIAGVEKAHSHDADWRHQMKQFRFENQGLVQLQVLRRRGLTFLLDSNKLSVSGT